MFQATYQALIAPESAGRIAVLPWDTRLFGFAVADLAAGGGADLAANEAALAPALGDWAAANAVELIACSCAGDDPLGLAALGRLGFALVDYGLQANLPRLQAARWSSDGGMVRQAAPEDRAGVVAIARRAFRFGRYHSDPRFPDALADERYGQWVANVFDSPQPEDRMFVIGEVGAPGGFFHVAVRGALADLRLGAVDPELQSGIGGYHLYLGTLASLRAAGLRRATARISAANTAVLNLYAMLGFQFSQPQAIFHWHAPGAPHLLPPGPQ